MKNLNVSRSDEKNAIFNIENKIEKKYSQLSAVNTLVLMVSPDYSATAAMHVAHALSKNGEMCDILPIHIPYPDEDKSKYILKAADDIKQWHNFSDKTYENYLLVEAGVIKGGTYTWLTSVLKNEVNGEIITSTLYENIHSIFKSDIVGYYYDAEVVDLTFYYERENNHWK
jgi:hypothetical protein